MMTQPVESGHGELVLCSLFILIIPLGQGSLEEIQIICSFRADFGGIPEIVTLRARVPHNEAFQ